MKPILKVKKLTKSAILPKYQTNGAACFDLHAATVAGMREMGSAVSKGHPLTCGTGLAFEVPEGHVMLVFSRSGHGFKEGLRLCNSTGVIDSDYRGEVMVKLQADHPRPDWPRVGERVAQAMLVKLPVVELEEVDELTDTKRGQGGFGSTGV